MRRWSPDPWCPKPLLLVVNDQWRVTTMGYRWGDHEGAGATVHATDSGWRYQTLLPLEGWSKRASGE